MHRFVAGQRQAFELRNLIRSLRVRNYRLYFSGQLVSVIGTWMQTVAQSFLVLHLTKTVGRRSGLRPRRVSCRCSCSARSAAWQQTASTSG